MAPPTKRSIPVMQAPPRDEQELLDRARRLAGQRVAEVAEDLGSRPPSSLAKAKGYIGELAEAALGTPRSSRPEPDFVALGVELKTLPLGASGQPIESTYVCRVDPQLLAEGSWSSSRVRHKIARVLFVPVEGSKDVPVSARTFGAAFLWSPTDDDELLLRTDWEDFADLARRGLLASVTAHRGHILQVRPKAASAKDRQRQAGPDGDFVAAPRGFYLRASFTGALMVRALGG